MRILSGQHKGQKLCSFPKSLPIRPMTQRVKKSVFSTLSPYFENKIHVLDLFSGCGNLSFEALSRGADQVCAVEQNRKCCQVIQKNAEKLKIKSQFKLYCQDVFMFLKQHSASPPFDLIFIDPPFKKMYGQALIKSLHSSSVCTQESLVVLEISKQEAFCDEVQLWKKKHFGDKTVYFFHLKK